VKNCWDSLSDVRLLLHNLNIKQHPLLSYLARSLVRSLVIHKYKFHQVSSWQSTVKTDDRTVKSRTYIGIKKTLHSKKGKLDYQL